MRDCCRPCGRRARTLLHRKQNAARTNRPFFQERDRYPDGASADGAKGAKGATGQSILERSPATTRIRAGASRHLKNVVKAPAIDDA